MGRCSSHPDTGSVQLGSNVENMSEAHRSHPHSLTDHHTSTIWECIWGQKTNQRRKVLVEELKIIKLSLENGFTYSSLFPQRNCVLEQSATHCILKPTARPMKWSGHSHLAVVPPGPIRHRWLQVRWWSLQGLSSRKMLIKQSNEDHIS